jgi:uncharacterized protein (DUF2141 family)
MPHHRPSHDLPRHRALRAAIALAALCGGAAAAGSLTIDISGFRPDRGQIYVGVYDRSETFPIAGRQLVGRILAAEGHEVRVRFENLPPGRYAAVAFQDENGNGKLDKNFLGIPKEPYGFSNGARGSGGPPSFSAAAVELAPDGDTRIVLQ